ncbi:MAG: FMN-binding protein [Coriobacteriia bacterium]|nr:FMN-binding protein [Coriobacteriia bacterium]
MSSTRNKFITGLMTMMIIASFGVLSACGAPQTDEAQQGAEAQAAAYKDGTYEGVGKGLKGDIPVSVTVSDGKITEVKVGENSETPEKAESVIESLPGKIVEANGTEGVDVVEGATMTSQGVIDGVNAALEQAK